MRTSSNTSSEHVAEMAAAARPTIRSTAIRSGGLVSRAPWWRRFTVPSAW
jgi:hypothetical protein